MISNCSNDSISWSFQTIMDDTDGHYGPSRVKPILLGGEDALEEDEIMPMAPPMEGVDGSDSLISKIITPSPYVHHQTGATAARFRNALQRVTDSPTSDVEAWQALITEASACYRNIQPQLHKVDADTHAKLDWIESCYGALLKHFPYSSPYYVTVVEMLLAQSARVGEEEGPLMDLGMDVSQRAARCEQKAERVFRDVLGVEMDGIPIMDSILGGLCTSSVELWLLYIRKRVRDTQRHARTMPLGGEQEKFVREWTKKAYEVAVENASFVSGNHVLWKQYLEWVKSWIPNPAMNVDHALGQQQMINLRSIYQRLVTHPMTGLDQLYQEYEAFERGQSEALAQALLQEYTPKYQHARSTYLERNRVYNIADLQIGRLATPPVDISEEDYAAKMQEEIQLLSLWKKRCSYERTNPERLESGALATRVRQAHKEMICVLTRHPEAWHMWSSWEITQAGADDKVDYAVSVLELGQEHIPDSTLLAYAEVQLLERYTDTPADGLAVMESFLERSPNTLGFVLFQQLVRRYKGIKEARAVFARARRVLNEDAATESSQVDGAEKAEVKQEVPDGEDGAEVAAKVVTAESGKRHMVTNRLDPEVGKAVKSSKTEGNSEGENDSPGEELEFKIIPGRITWQLYASHANMEYRLNNSPEIAARVYELGLRKHISFLTKTPYVLRYAQLLMELQDTENLRALLTRAVSACEASEGNAAAAAAFWDMSLQFETILSGTDPANIASLAKVEQRRHAALMGPEVEDVATGGLIGVGDNGVAIGSTKSSIAEQLIRAEGYDVSSSIVNGMSRLTNVLELVGLWGDGDGVTGRQGKLRNRESEWDAGGHSDACYQRRLNFQRRAASGLSIDAALDGEGGAKHLSARERLQQGAGTGNQPAQSSAVQLAIQQAPEWLRPLLNLLPASRHRAAILSKPPPHMVEMVMTSLRNHALPAERPSGKNGASTKRKANDGDSSDEEDLFGGGGYGSQFRDRQSKRLVALNGTGS
jgi:hypothetical protein